MPDYHYEIPKVANRFKLTVGFYRATKLLRGPRRRRIATKILFSPLGPVFNAINQVRKKIFLRLEGN